MTASTFIFVHDQQIVLDYIAAGKFSDLPDVKYCFLGMRPTDRIEHLPNVIIARNLPDNIEHYPNLVAWTGWYALMANNLVHTGVVNLFEYDVNVVGEWKQSQIETAYFGYPSTDEVWWNYNGIRSELEKVLDAKYQEIALPMTSNYTLNRITLSFAASTIKAYIEHKAIDPLHPQAGHIIERIFSAMYSDFSLDLDRLTHLYADSHGTQGRGDRYQQLKSKLL